MKVYAVVFSNYDPSEVHGLFETWEDANREAERLNEASDWEPWRVLEWSVSPASGDQTATKTTDPERSDP